MSSVISEDRPSRSTTREPPGGFSRANRVLVIVSAISAVVPFYWAAIRDAHNGYYPTLDVAATVLRARAVFSSQPPMVGMWSSGSSWAGHEIHFPGATQLYLLAIPTHVLGNTWGPLLAMATINVGWVLLAGWLLYRRLGVNSALVGFLFIALFVWSIGSENLIDARPMEMVTIPFLCFLFAVWAVASDDIDVIPALAVVANYLFLNHLVLALQVPVIGICALAGVILWIRNNRAPGPEGQPGQLRRLRRRLLQAGAITLVMWLPSLIQEVRGNPGNLSLLVAASGHNRHPVGSVTAGYNATIWLITKPTFWFRGSFEDPSFRKGIYHLSFGDVIAGIALAALIAILGVLAWRRRDKLSLAALAVSVVGILISIETVIQAPAQWGFPVQYLRSLWGMAAFVWFAIALNIYRLISHRFQTVHVRTATVAGVATIAVLILSLSYANFGSALDMPTAKRAHKLVDTVVPQLVGRGDVYVSSGPDFMSQRYFSPLLLGLDTAGVRYCVSQSTAEQYGAAHACGKDAKVFVRVVAHDGRPSADAGRVLNSQSLLDPGAEREFAATERSVHDYFSSHDSIALSKHAYNLFNSYDPDAAKAVVKTLSGVNSDTERLLDSAAFRILLQVQVAHQRNPAGNPPMFADPDFPAAKMQKYMQLRNHRKKAGTIWVLEARPRR